MSLIIVHEFGHLLMAKHYKWNTDKIYIYPLGGITKFDVIINKPLKEELLIMLMGPIFQVVYFYLLTFLFPFPFSFFLFFNTYQSLNNSRCG